jgi:hypothetical protein
MVLAASASALSLSLAASSATITPSTEGKIFMTISNDGSEKLVSLSARAPHLQVFFDASALRLQAFETKGTYIRFTSIPGFKGVEDIDVFAEWSENGQIKRATKTLRVFVDGTGSVNSGPAPVRNYVPGTYSGQDGSYQLQSYVESQAFFDPAQYSVDVKLDSDQVGVTAFPGQLSRMRVMLINKGAAGSFDLMAISGDENAAVTVINTPVTLLRGEAKTVFVDIQPASRIQAGRYWFTFEVLSQGYVVKEREMYFDVQDKFDAVIKINSPITVTQSTTPVKIQATIQNTGTAKDTYVLSTKNAFASVPQRITLNGGDRATFDITLDTSKMTQGENLLEIRAESDKVQGAGTAKIILEKAQTPITSIDIDLKNTYGQDLDSVTVSIEGIPSTWEVIKPLPFALRAGETKTISVQIKQATNEEAANPVLVVKNGATVLERRPLPAIKAAGGLTGLFTAGANVSTAAILIIAALIIAAFYARQKEQRAKSQDFEAKMKKIRDALQKIREA